MNVIVTDEEWLEIEDNLTLLANKKNYQPALNYFLFLIYGEEYDKLEMTAIEIYENLISILLLILRQSLMDERYHVTTLVNVARTSQEHLTRQIIKTYHNGKDKNELLASLIYTDDFWKLQEKHFIEELLKLTK